jgi:hypothetical protein
MAHKPAGQLPLSQPGWVPERGAPGGDWNMKIKYLAAAGISAVALAVAGLGVTPASARWHHHDGGAVAAGILGGVAAGALIGGAVAGAYEPPPPPVYYAPAPPPVVYAPVCHIEHQRVWVRGYGWSWGRVQVCD